MRGQAETLAAETEEQRLTSMSANQVDRLAVENAQQHETRLRSHRERCEVHSVPPAMFLVSHNC